MVAQKQGSGAQPQVVSSELIALHGAEVKSGSRFEFGGNWRRFLDHLDETRIAIARESVDRWLGARSLEGQTFLDIGSGSGLFSLAARQLGARVVSFDFDPESVRCALWLRQRYKVDEASWKIVHGSVLDSEFLHSLGQFDVVYSWGVLHHTGQMWRAIENAAGLVKDGGRIWISLYNDQGWPSRGWLKVKRAYNRLPRALRWVILAPALMRLWGPTMFRDLARGRPFSTYLSYKARSRGMSPLHDVVDWVGGLPFEVAKPEEVFRFLQKRDFSLVDLSTCAGGHGCNEYLFTKMAYGWKPPVGRT